MIFLWPENKCDSPAILEQGDILTIIDKDHGFFSGMKNNAVTVLYKNKIYQIFNKHINEVFENLRSK